MVARPPTWTVAFVLFGVTKAAWLWGMGKPSCPIAEVSNAESAFSGSPTSSFVFGMASPKKKK